MRALRIGINGRAASRSLVAGLLLLGGLLAQVGDAVFQLGGVVVIVEIAVRQVAIALQLGLGLGDLIGQRTGAADGERGVDGLASHLLDAPPRPFDRAEVLLDQGRAFGDHVGIEAHRLGGGVLLTPLVLQRADVVELGAAQEVVLVIEVQQRFDRVVAQFGELGDGLVDGAAGGHAHLFGRYRHQFDLLTGELTGRHHLGQRGRGAALRDAAHGVHLLGQRAQVAGGHAGIAAREDQRLIEPYGLLAALEIRQRCTANRRHHAGNRERQWVQTEPHSSQRTAHRMRCIIDVISGLGCIAQRLLRLVSCTRQPIVTTNQVDYVAEAEQRLKTLSEQVYRIADTAERISDLPALLYRDQPYRHAAGQAGGDVGDLHRQLTHGLLVLPGTDAGGAHRIGGAAETLALLLELRVVGVEGVQVDLA